MTLRTLTCMSVSVAAAVAMIACERGMTPASPDVNMSAAAPLAAPSAGPGGAGPAIPRQSSDRDHDRMVTIHDACDPTTFNAVLGAGSCTRNGGVTFQQFIDELTRSGVARQWFFAPPNATLREGDTFVVVNHGGETHTFTEVENFGGGLFPNLNALAHTPVVAPECTTLDSDDFIPAGGTYREKATEAGREKYQCCIHPWMRLEARINAK